MRKFPKQSIKLIEHDKKKTRADFELKVSDDEDEDASPLSLWTETIVGLTNLNMI